MDQQQQWETICRKVSGAALIRLPPAAFCGLTSCPTAGDGVHQWLFACAGNLQRHVRDPQLVFHLLAAACADCGRDVPAREITDAIKNSAPGRANVLSGNLHLTRPSKAPKWPSKDYSAIERITREGPGLVDLFHQSPRRWRPDRTEEIIDTLFPGNPLLCCGWTNSRFATQPREDWRGSLVGLQFIVPSPMTAKQGRTKDGRLSEHCLDNTGPRKFLVAECDFTDRDKNGKETPDAPLIRAMRSIGKTINDICAAVLCHLAQFAPLVLAVHSGGKSLHGWYYCEGQNEALLSKFMQYAVSLGADPMTWTRCQFVRMPDGRRENGNEQRVVFFNPTPLRANGIETSQ